MRQLTLIGRLVFSRVQASLREELRILARGDDDTVAERRNSVG